MSSVTALCSSTAAEVLVTNSLTCSIAFLMALSAVTTYLEFHDEAISPIYGRPLFALRSPIPLTSERPPQDRGRLAPRADSIVTWRGGRLDRDAWNNCSVMPSMDSATASTYTCTSAASTCSRLRMPSRELTMVSESSADRGAHLFAAGHHRYDQRISGAFGAHARRGLCTSMRWHL